MALNYDDKMEKGEADRSMGATNSVASCSLLRIGSDNAAATNAEILAANSTGKYRQLLLDMALTGENRHGQALALVAEPEILQSYCNGTHDPQL
jgi:hypothetical protein